MIIKLFFFLLSSFYTVIGFAAEHQAISVYFLNKEMRYERNDQQELADVQPLNFAIDYRFNQISLELQYSDFKNKTGNSVNSIERHHNEVMLWGDYYFFDQQPTPSIQFYFFGGIGAGSYSESINTSFMGTSHEDAAKAKFLSGMNLGSQVFFDVTENINFVLSAEGRLLINGDFDPNPLPSAILRLGIQARL